MSRFVLRSSPEHESLRPLVARSLSRRIHRHYQGFAKGQLREWEKDGFRSAKKLLYVLRTMLTGVHALLTGEIETDVTLLLDGHGFGAARELVDAKRRGERSELAPPVSERWKAEVARAFEVLDAALTPLLFRPIRRTRGRSSSGSCRCVGEGSPSDSRW